MTEDFDSSAEEFDSGCELFESRSEHADSRASSLSEIPLIDQMDRDFTSISFKISGALLAART
jgi:hypothetical protein